MVGSVPGSRCKHIASVLHPGQLDLKHDVNTRCLRFERRKEWFATMSDVEVQVLGVMLSEKIRGIDPPLIEFLLRVEALERIKVNKETIKKEKNLVMKRKFEKEARRVAEWEAEEDSGWESLHIID